MLLSDFTLFMSENAAFITHGIIKRGYWSSIGFDNPVNDKIINLKNHISGDIFRIFSKTIVRQNIASLITETYNSFGIYILLIYLK